MLRKSILHDRVVCTYTIVLYVHTQQWCMYTHNSGVYRHTTVVYVHTQQWCI
jgi:hypothetical protein